MQSLTIESLLADRGAWLKGETPDFTDAEARANVTRRISWSYPTFEKLRDRIIENTDAYLHGKPMREDALASAENALLDQLVSGGVAFLSAQGQAICEAVGRRYLTGGWLEELAWLAARECGADEAVFGQVLGWKVKNFTGENEIDLIMRRGSHLSFVSCKALRSELDIHDRKHRNRLMDAVHEADNLADHFGRDGDTVAVLVTTDLIDEARGAVRYNALMGKAAVLNVRIIPLEELAFDQLTLALAGLLQPQQETKHP